MRCNACSGQGRVGGGACAVCRGSGGRDTGLTCTACQDQGCGLCCSGDVTYWKSKAAEMHALALEKDGKIQSEATVRECEDIMRELSAARTVLCLSVSPLRLEWCLKRLGHEGNHEIVNAEGVVSAGWRNRRDG